MTVKDQHGPGDSIAHTAPTPLKGLLILLVVVVGIAAYIGFAYSLGLTILYGGFFFAFYWTGLKGAALAEFWPSVIGAMGGIGLAWLLHILPAQYGAAGSAVAIGLVLLSVYLLIMGWLGLFINQAFMLFLTVATIPKIQTPDEMMRMIWALLAAAALLGSTVLTVQRIQARKAA